MELVAGQLRIQEEYGKILVMTGKRSVEEQILKVPCVPGGLPDYPCVCETPGDPASLGRRALPLNVFLTLRIAKTRKTDNIKLRQVVEQLPCQLACNTVQLLGKHVCRFLESRI